jgi:large conductance mechanosensitive channel
MASGGIVADFKKFLMQGNVVDLAVAVIIGGAFGKIVESFVKDLITPAILSPVLAAAKLENIKQLSYNGITYGNFLAEVINFLVIAFSIFIMIRALDKGKAKFKRQQAMETAASPSPEAVLQERMANTLDRLATVLDKR